MHRRDNNGTDWLFGSDSTLESVGKFKGFVALVGFDARRHAPKAQAHELRLTKVDEFNDRRTPLGAALERRES
jgi:hypothetical protein